MLEIYLKYFWNPDYSICYSKIHGKNDYLNKLKERIKEKIKTKNIGEKAWRCRPCVR